MRVLTIVPTATSYHVLILPNIPIGGSVGVTGGKALNSWEEMREYLLNVEHVPPHLIPKHPVTSPYNIEIP